MLVWVGPGHQCAVATVASGSVSARSREFGVLSKVLYSDGSSFMFLERDSRMRLVDSDGVLCVD